MTCRMEMQSASAEAADFIGTSSVRSFVRKPGRNNLFEHPAFDGLVGLYRAVPPPGIIGHRLGGCDKPVGDRGEIILAIIEAEDQAAGSDPTQSEARCTKIILQHPIVAGRLRVENRPYRGHICNLHRQSLGTQAVIEVLS